MTEPRTAPDPTPLYPPPASGPPRRNEGTDHGGRLWLHATIGPSARPSAPSRHGPASSATRCTSTFRTSTRSTRRARNIACEPRSAGSDQLGRHLRSARPTRAWPRRPLWLVPGQRADVSAILGDAMAAEPTTRPRCARTSSTDT